MSLDRHSLAALLQSIAAKKLLVLGDFMVDRTIYGEASRISPEAPTPVILAQEQCHQLGGAGNVVRNLISLGGKVFCVAVVGEDEAGDVLERELRAVCSSQSFQILREPGRKTTRKTRVVAVDAGHSSGRAVLRGHQQVIRIDEETRSPISAHTATRIMKFAAELIGEADGVVISDYAKGAVPPSLIEQIIGLARFSGKPAFVDPKAKDFSRYAGASVLTPNAAEAEAALGLSLAMEPLREGWDGIVREQLERLNLDAMLITRGRQGVSLVDRQGFHHFPTSARELFDVTGAGDTLIAAFSLAVAAGASYAQAAQFGNLAAGVAVGKPGAAVVFPFELQRELGIRHYSAEVKILGREELAAVAEALRRESKKVVFTNGCFDLLHVGHLYLLQQARQFGDALVVGLNSDASVRRLKGDGRPMISADDRAFALAALECVDFVVIFDESDPLELIRSIRPDVLVKGGDYVESEIVGSEFLKSYGGVTRIVPLREGVSTSRLVEKLARLERET